MSDATSNLSKGEQFDELVSPSLDTQTPDNELSQEQIELDQG